MYFLICLLYEQCMIWSGISDSNRFRQLGRLSPLPGEIPQHSYILKYSLINVNYKVLNVRYFFGRGGLGAITGTIFV